jgi:HlyD family secretion protein
VKNTEPAVAHEHGKRSDDLLRTWMKVVIVILVVALVGGGVYWFFLRPKSSSSSTAQTTVVPVRKGNVVESTSLSGTVALKGQVNVIPKASGRVVSVSVQVGQTVQAGDELLRLDMSSMDTDISLAGLSLETAQLRLQQLQEPVRDADLAPFKLSLENAKNNLAQAQANRTRAQQAVDLNLTTAQRAVDKAKTDLQTAQESLELTKQSNEKALEIAQTAVDNAQSDLDNISDEASKNSVERNLQSAQQKLDSQQLNNQQSLQSAQSRVQSAQDAITDAEQALEQRKLSNQDSLASADDQANSAQASIQSAQLQLDQKTAPVSSTTDLELQQKAVEQAQLNLQKLLDQQAQAVLEASVSGIVSAINATVGDMISTNSTAVVLVSQDSLEIVANVPQVSVADLHPGVAAAITADALPGKTFTATLSSISPFASSSQGVVNYTAHFATSGDASQQLLQGMTVQVVVTTAQANNVLVVPRTAITTVSGKDLVLVQTPTGTRPQLVQVGLQDDTMAEIKSGLSVSDKVEVSFTAAASASGMAGLLGSMTGDFGGGPFQGGTRPSGTRPSGTTNGSGSTNGATSAPVGAGGGQ